MCTKYTRITVNFYFCFYSNIVRDVVTILPIFVNIYHSNYMFAHTQTEAHTHEHTGSIISTQEEWRLGQPGTGTWLGGAEERFSVRDKGPAMGIPVRTKGTGNTEHMFSQWGLGGTGNREQVKVERSETPRRAAGG